MRRRILSPAILLVAVFVLLSCGRLRIDGPIVLIVVDTVRADRLTGCGYERRTMPRLESWAVSGRAYERALATSSWTLPSFASVLTGHLPSGHGAGQVIQLRGQSHLSRLDERARTLAEIFRDAGFEAAAIVNNPFLAPEFGLDRGFGRYDHALGDNDTARRADTVVDRAVRWIDQQEDRHYFLVVHLFDPHMNYDAPEPARGRFTGQGHSDLSLPVQDLQRLRSLAPILPVAEREFVVAAYDEELAWVDLQLARLLETLEARGVFDSGLIILTSDHGEELFDHGGFEHGHALWQELLHVPLIFWGRGVLPGYEADAVSLVDVVPTALDAAGLTIPTGLTGISLWANMTAGESIPARTLFAEGILNGAEQQAVIRWPHKLVLEVDGGQRRLFDLASDPGEQTDLAASRPDLVNTLMREIHAGRRAGSPHRDHPPPARLDPETVEALRTLGYLDRR